MNCSYVLLSEGDGTDPKQRLAIWLSEIRSNKLERY